MTTTTRSIALSRTACLMCCEDHDHGFIGGGDSSQLWSSRRPLQFRLSTPPAAHAFADSVAAEAVATALEAPEALLLLARTQRHTQHSATVRRSAHFCPAIPYTPCGLIEPSMPHARPLAKSFRYAHNCAPSLNPAARTANVKWMKQYHGLKATFTKSCAFGAATHRLSPGDGFFLMENGTSRIVQVSANRGPRKSNATTRKT